MIIMITFVLSFFASLQPLFGFQHIIKVEYPIRVIELFDLFTDQNGIVATQFFLWGEMQLKEDFMILVDGKNIHGMDGMKTVLDHDCDISFFPRIGGGA